MLVVIWLLARKVESVGHMNSTIAMLMNACSYLTTSLEGRIISNNFLYTFPGSFLEFMNNYKFENALS
jgi:hypothetical protein